MPGCPETKLPQGGCDFLRRHRHRKSGYCAVRHGADFLLRCLGQSQHSGPCGAGGGVCGGLRLHSRRAFAHQRFRGRGHHGFVTQCPPGAVHLHQCLPFPYPAGAEFADGLRSEKLPAFPTYFAYQFQVHSRAAYVLFFRMRQGIRQQSLPDSLQPAAAGGLWVWTAAP